MIVLEINCFLTNPSAKHAARLIDMEIPSAGPIKSVDFILQSRLQYLITIISFLVCQHNQGMHAYPPLTDRAEAHIPVLSIRI